MSRLFIFTLFIVAVYGQGQAAPAATPAAQQAAPTVDLSSVHQKLDTLSQSVQSLSELRSSLNTLSTSQTNLQSSLQQLTQDSSALKQAVQQQGQASASATPAAPVDVSQLTNKFTESQSSLTALSASIERTLTQLTAAQQATEKSKESVTELANKAEAKWNTITAELKEIKSLLQSLSAASASKKDDTKGHSEHTSLLSKIHETQTAILHKLEHNSVSAQFWNGYEQLRTHAVHYGRELWALTERGVARAQEYAPIVTEKAQSVYDHLSTDGIKHANTAYTAGQEFVVDSHGHLTTILSQQGVPQEHAPLASISILALLGLLVVILWVKLLFAFLRCITCRSGKKTAKKGPVSATATPAKKK